MELSVASWQRLLSLLLGFTVFVLPLALCERPSNLSYDEAAYYLPAVERIRGHWPALDIRNDSLSATAPGYLYFLATVSQVTGSARLTLRLINLAVSVGVLVTCWWFLSRTVATPFLFLLPLALSNFFIKSAGYIVTDNAALLGIALTLAAALFGRSKGHAYGAAGCATLAVVIRQNSIWLLVPLAGKLLRQARDSNRAAPLLALLMPVLPFVILIVAWQGLVPPVWQSTQVQSGITFMPVLYALTVLAAMGAPFYLAMTSASHWRTDVSCRWAWAAAILTLVVAATTHSLPGSATGNWGGYWWNLAAKTPAIGEVSLFFAFVAPIGAWLAGAAFHRLWREAGPTVALPFMLTVLAWLVTTLANRLVFQRYYEPTILLFLLCWAAMLASARSEKKPLRRWPMVALVAAQLACTLITAHGQAYGYFGS